MHKTPARTTQLIHDNLWVVLSFCFSRPTLEKILNDKFQGDWKALVKTIGPDAEQRADRALLEMATQIRVLDDEQGLQKYFTESHTAPVGSVTDRAGKEGKLNLRQMTNKVIHGQSFEWHLTGSGPPFIRVISHASQNWAHADIDLHDLMFYVGQLAH